MEKEEKEAMWEKLRDLEKSIFKLGQDNIEIAQEAAISEILSGYHLIMTLSIVLEVSGKKGIGSSYVNYMKPRCESAEQAIYRTKSSKDAFKIASDFNEDCHNYLKSLIA